MKSKRRWSHYSFNEISTEAVSLSSGIMQIGDVFVSRLLSKPTATNSSQAAFDLSGSGTFMEMITALAASPKLLIFSVWVSLCAAPSSLLTLSLCGRLSDGITWLWARELRCLLKKISSLCPVLRRVSKPNKAISKQDQTWLDAEMLKTKELL